MKHTDKGHACIAFSMSSAFEAWKHMDGYEVIERYGEQCNGHWLHTWDDGERLLVRCRSCGGYILVQKSEFHGREDDYYTDYFPVASSEEAHALNEWFDGFSIEEGFPDRFLMSTNGRLSWSK